MCMKSWIIFFFFCLCNINRIFKTRDKKKLRFAETQFVKEWITSHFFSSNSNVSLFVTRLFWKRANYDLRLARLIINQVKKKCIRFVACSRKTRSILIRFENKRTTNNLFNLTANVNLAYFQNKRITNYVFGSACCRP